MCIYISNIIPRSNNQTQIGKYSFPILILYDIDRAKGREKVLLTLFLLRSVSLWFLYFFCLLLSTFAVGEQAIFSLSSAAVHILVLYYMILSGPDD